MSKVDEHAPDRNLTRKEFKQTVKPWITSNILQQIKERDKLRLKSIKEKNDIERTRLLDNYKSLRNRIVDQIRENKQNYYKQYFELHKQNLRKTWTRIKSIININNQPSSNATTILYI